MTLHGIRLPRRGSGPRGSRCCCRSPASRCSRCSGRWRARCSACPTRTRTRRRRSPRCAARSSATPSPGVKHIVVDLPRRVRVQPATSCASPTHPDAARHAAAPSWAIPAGSRLVQHLGRRLQPRLLLPGRLAEPAVRRQRRRLRDAHRERAARVRRSWRGRSRPRRPAPVALDAARRRLRRGADEPVPHRRPSIRTARRSRQPSRSGSACCASSSRSGRRRRGRRIRARAWHSGRSSRSPPLVLVNARALGPLWLVIVVGALLPRERMGAGAALFTTRSSYAWLAIIAVGRAVLARLDALGREPLGPGRGGRRAARRRHVPAGVRAHDPGDARLPAAGGRVLRLAGHAAAGLGVLVLRRGVRGRSSCSASTALAGGACWCSSWSCSSPRCSCRRSCRAPACTRRASSGRAGTGSSSTSASRSSPAWLLSRRCRRASTSSPRGSPGSAPALIAAYGVLAFWLVLVRYVDRGDARRSAQMCHGTRSGSRRSAGCRSRSATRLASTRPRRARRRRGARDPSRRGATPRRMPAAAAPCSRSRRRRARCAEPRVAIAYDCLFPVDTGGGERVYRRMAELLVERGARSTYVTRADWAADAAPHAPFDIVRRLARRDPRRRRHAHARRARSAFAAALFRHFVRHRGDYDLVVVAALPGAQRVRRAPRPPRHAHASSRSTGSRSGRGASGAPTRARSPAPIACGAAVARRARRRASRP